MEILATNEVETKISKMSTEEIIKIMKETKYEINQHDHKYMTNLYLMLREFIRYKCTYCMYHDKNGRGFHFCRKDNFLSSGKELHKLGGCDDFINNQSLDALSRKAGVMQYRY